MPDVLDVEDALSLIADRPLTNFTGPFEIQSVLTNGSWDDVIAEYDSIRIEAIMTDGSLDYLNTAEVQVDNIIPGRRVRMLDGLFGTDTNFNLEFGFENTTTGNLRIISSVGSLANWTQIGVRIWGIKAQKVVIDVDNFEITNPDAADSNLVLSLNGDGTGTFRGLTLQSPDGTNYQLSVDNSGGLITTQI